MKIEYDNKEILKILNDFSNCTNLIASCHFDEIEFKSQSTTKMESFSSNNNGEDLNFFDEIRKNNENTHYCLYIQENRSNVIKCGNDSIFYKKKAKQERKTIIYSCHAGLCETVTPIILDNTVVGYIMLGKFIDEDNYYSTIEKVKETAKRYNLDENKLLSLYEKLPIISTKHLHSAINILQLCITQILEKHFIKVKNLALIEEIHTYVLNNLSSPLFIEDICEKFYINRQKLHTLFKKHFNDSVKHFIITQRIEQAKKLLLESDKNVSEIAEIVGFDNYNYFIRIFKNIVGLPPLQYKKKYSQTK
jgi:AraC-like DNA-binding protein